MPATKASRKKPGVVKTTHPKQLNWNSAVWLTSELEKAKLSCWAWKRGTVTKMLPLRCDHSSGGKCVEQVQADLRKV